MSKVVTKKPTDNSSNQQNPNNQRYSFYRSDILNKYIHSQNVNDKTRLKAIEMRGKNHALLKELNDISPDQKQVLSKHLQALDIKYMDTLLRISDDAKNITYLEKENNILNVKIAEMEQENKIFVPKPSDKKLNKKEFKALEHIIYEINVTYDHKAYTALSLLARKVIVNLGHVLLSELHQKEKQEGKVNIIKGTWKDIIKANDYEFIEVKISKLQFTSWLNWMYKERYLTKNNFELINNMKDKSNELNHEMGYSDSLEEAKKFYLSIKEMIESNFDSKNIGDFSTKKKNTEPWLDIQHSSLNPNNIRIKQAGNIFGILEKRHLFKWDSYEEDPFSDMFEFEGEDWEVDF